MALTVEQAYEQIKQLEHTGQLTLPEPKDTVTVGTIDFATGAFTWTAPTFTKTIVIPPNPPITRTNTIINTTVGLVATKAVDLILKFAIKNAPHRIVLQPRATTAASAPITRVGSGVTGVSVTGIFDTPSGIKIGGFPTILDTSTEIRVDAGLAVSAAIQSLNVTPPITTFPLQITIPGHPVANLEIVIVRPPVLGVGAFTIPAVPLTIIYAPPQGKQQKNSTTYSDMTSFTRSVTTTVNQSNTVKTAQAYTAADIISKVAGAIATVAAIVGTGGAGAGSGGVAGALGSLLTALVGSPDAQQAALSTSDSLKLVSGELTAVSTILTAVDTNTSSQSNTVSSQQDHTVKLTLSDMSTFSSSAGQGPGVGDRIVYFKNVRVVWMALNGEVGIHVLGFEKVSADSVASLKADLTAATSSGQNNSGLDAATLKSLLAMDPFCATRRIALGPPVVAPPRFIPASPAERSGVGTGSQGDVFTVVFDKTVEDKTTQTSTNTTVTDEKPGWVSVMFGGSDTETTTTVTFTNTLVSDLQNEEKITNTVTLFSQDATDPYDVRIFYDTTFGTFLYADKNSSVLVGTTVISTGTTVVRSATV